MKDGFIRAAAATPTVKVADPVWNGEQILGMIQEGNKEGAKITSLQDPLRKMSKSDENPNASVYLADDKDTRGPEKNWKS